LGAARGAGTLVMNASSGRASAGGVGRARSVRTFLGPRSFLAVDETMTPPRSTSLHECDPAGGYEPVWRIRRQNPWRDERLNRAAGDDCANCATRRATRTTPSVRRASRTVEVCRTTREPIAPPARIEKADRMRFAQIRRRRCRPVTSRGWPRLSGYRVGEIRMSDSPGARRNGRIALDEKNSSYSDMDTVVAVR